MRIERVYFESSVRLPDSETRVGCIVTVEPMDKQELGKAMEMAKEFVIRESAKVNPESSDTIAVKVALADKLEEIAKKARDETMPF